jgi:hypothetical protein
MAAWSFAPQISTIKSNLPPIACPMQIFKNLPNLYTFTLKVATAVFCKSLDNTQHSTRLNREG